MYPEILADVLYTIYCESVGGRAFNNDPLPNWAAFRADHAKKKQSDAWVEVARKAISVLKED